MRQQHWQESRALFESAIREYPRYDLAYNGLGMVEVELNEMDAARESSAPRGFLQAEPRVAVPVIRLGTEVLGSAQPPRAPG